MQLHSSALWTSMLNGDKNFGIGSSVMVEFTALFFWWHAKDFKTAKGIGLHFLAIATSLIVISTAFLELSEPIKKSEVENSLNTKQQKLNSETIQTAKKMGEGATKYGNHKVSNKSMNLILELQEKQTKLITDENKKVNSFDLNFKLSIQAITLALMMIAQIVANQLIRNNFEKKDERHRNKITTKKEELEDEIVKEEQSKGTSGNGVLYSAKALLAQKLIELIQAEVGTIGNTTDAKLAEALGGNRNIWNKLGNSAREEPYGVGQDKMHSMMAMLKDKNYSIK